MLTTSFHDFGDNFKLQEQLSRGSVVVVHEEPHPQMTGTLSYRPEETGGRQREKSQTHDSGDWTTDIAFYRGQKTARGAMGLQFLFMDDNAPCHCTVAAEQLLETEDIERMDWPARSRISSHRAHRA
ncbi:hypothetical protein TNCV_2928311 [Trichonephila clavipes]|nr:hypothetical protein TNCV_2928311 [Trichonephila clavipes]